MQLLTLRVSQKSVVTIGFQGFTTIQTLTAPDAAVKLSGSGCLTVANNLNYGVLNVERGNVRLPSGASSDNGRRPVVFDAPGAEQAYVDGKFFTYVKTGSDGKVTLWLPVLGEGASYWGRMNGNTLEVSSLAEPPAEGDKVDLSVTDPSRQKKEKATPFTPSDPDNQGRLINGAAGVSFTLSGVGTKDSAPTFQGTGTLYVSGDNYLKELSGPYAVSGTGRLHVGRLSAPNLTAQGGLTIRADTGGAPTAWTKVPVSGGEMTLDLTAEYNGAAVPALFLAASPQTAYAPLPAAATGYHYEGTVKGGKLLVEAVENEQGELINLDASGHTFNAAGNYRIVSEGGTSGQIVVADGVSVKLTLAELSPAAICASARALRFARAAGRQCRGAGGGGRRRDPVAERHGRRWTRPAFPAAAPSALPKPPTSASPAARRCPAAPPAHRDRRDRRSERAHGARANRAQAGKSGALQRHHRQKRNRYPLAHSGAERHGRGGAQRSGHLRRRHQRRHGQPRRAARHPQRQGRPLRLHHL